MKCLFIGPLGNHAVIGRVAAFAGACDDIVLLDGGSHHWSNNTYPVKNLTVYGTLEDEFYRHHQRLRIRIMEVARLCGAVPEDAALIAEIKSAVRQFNPDFAVLHPGPVASHYLRVIKRSGMRLPAILVPNMLPGYVRPSRIGVASVLHVLSGMAEHLGYSRWLRSADGIIFPSDEMMKYVSQKYGPLPRHTCIIPDYLPKAWQAKRETRGDFGPASRGEASVVFLGAPERYGPVIDSIDDQFMELAAAKVHVYSGAMSDAVCRSGFGHIYPKFSDEEVFAGRLAEFASQFDAALITYNVKRREERFRSTYPTRFLTALGVGIPIAIRGGIFDACERFVEHYGIGFSYKNEEQLVSRLKDTGKMAAYRRRANQVKAQFSAEEQIGELKVFLSSFKRAVFAERF